MFFASYCRSFCAMTRIKADDDTIPVLTASGRMSSNTASSSSARNAGVASMTLRTPVVFCAVSAVTALMANTPFMVMVFRSA